MYNGGTKMQNPETRMVLHCQATDVFDCRSIPSFEKPDNLSQPLI